MTTVSVAVIGLGALGLVTVKNLLEEGYDVTGYDKNPYIGGLWHFNPDSGTSALESTRLNISKERTASTFIPSASALSLLFDLLSIDVPSHPNAAQVEAYLEDYVNHFQFRQHLVLDTNISKVTRDDETGKWILHFTSGEVKEQKVFDKVVIANGPLNRPNQPRLAGEDTFKGRSLHSYDFKTPSDFKGKRIMVVGSSNSAADTSTILCGIASDIYLAHRSGAFILPRRLKDGSVLDHAVSYRKTAIQFGITKWSPRLAEKGFNSFLQKLQDDNFHVRPEWHMNAPSVVHAVPTVSDTLVAELEAGRIHSVAAPVKITENGRGIELHDGTVIDDIDALIWCTGYKMNFDIVGKYDPTLVNHENDTDTQTIATPHQDPSQPIPRLYRNIFSLQHPSSLAFIGTLAYSAPIFVAADLASMAIAQCWHPHNADLTPLFLPSKAEMVASVNRHLAWADAIAARGPFNPRQIDPAAWHTWVEEAAGVRVAENLGYGLEGWRFWLRERELCGLLMDGVLTPHMYRLFDGGARRDGTATETVTVTGGVERRAQGRKAWDGARNEIFKVNRLIAEQKRKINLGKDKAV